MKNETQIVSKKHPNLNQHSRYQKIYGRTKTKKIFNNV